MEIMYSASYRNRNEVTALPCRSIFRSSYHFSASQFGVCNWNEHRNDLVIFCKDVPNPQGTCHHDYSLQLSASDITELIATIGEAVSKSEAKALREYLKKNAALIASILAFATGSSQI